MFYSVPLTEERLTEMFLGNKKYYTFSFLNEVPDTCSDFHSDYINGKFTAWIGSHIAQCG